MSISIDTDEDIDNNLDSGIAGFEIAYNSANKEAIRKAIRKAKNNQLHVKQKLDSINEKRSLDRQLDSFSNYWDF